MFTLRVRVPDFIRPFQLGSGCSNAKQRVLFSLGGHSGPCTYTWVTWQHVPLQLQRFVCIHPGRLTWNIQITHLERKMIFQTSMIMFHVNLQGCVCPERCLFQTFLCHFSMPGFPSVPFGGWPNWTISLATFIRRRTLFAIGGEPKKTDFEQILRGLLSWNGGLP